MRRSAKGCALEVSRFAAGCVSDASRPKHTGSPVACSSQYVPALHQLVMWWGPFWPLPWGPGADIQLGLSQPTSLRHVCDLNPCSGVCTRQGNPECAS